MALVLLAAGHHDIDLVDVERLSVPSDHLALAVAADEAVRGVMVLATCNRLEIYLDAHPSHLTAAAERALRVLSEASGVPLEQVEALVRVSERRTALQHLFDVASGLDSMVVGEREITGQVRRAIDRSRELGVASSLLQTAVAHALKASRRVAVATDLARSGRSVVSVALDLAGARREADGCQRACPIWAGKAISLPQADWSGATAVLVGTGAYAGASLATLRSRGCRDVVVHSASGRAQAFAESHDCDALPADDPDALLRALARADLVVSCRGTGTPTLDVDLMRRAVELRRTLRPGIGSLTVLDLALHADVEREVRNLPGVVLIDLEAVRAHSPAAVMGEVDRAQEIVAQAVAELTAEAAGRSMDQVVVAIRRHVAESLEAELERLPQSGMVSAADAAQAMRRLVATLLHQPTVNARQAGREGRGPEFSAALEQVLGIETRHLLPEEPPVAPAAPKPDSTGPRAVRPLRHAPRKASR